MYSRICSAKFGFALSLSLRKCLTGIVVTDILSDSLNYSNKATVHYPNCTIIHREPDIFQPNPDGTTTIEWYFDKLNKSETITIEFDAHKNKSCNNNNTQYVKAWCNETGKWVTGTSTAYIFCEVPAITPLSFLLALLSLFGLGAVAMRKMYKR